MINERKRKDTIPIFHYTMHDSDIDIKIIYKKIEGTLNADENRLFEEWFQTPAHRRYFKNIKEYYELGHEPSIGQEQTDHAWIKLGKRIKTHKQAQKHRIIYAFMAAAAIAILLVTTPLWLQRNNPAVPEKIAVTEIIPGKNNAILELSDGRCMNLEQLSQENKKRLEEYARIDSNRLNYNNTTKNEARILQYNKITVPRGGEFQLVLEDDTKIWLNSESKLKFPVIFGQDKREVYLEGEAYFEVSKDAGRPFTVYAGKQKVTVLGTSFGITSYSEENCETTTLVEGKVKVEFPQHPHETYTLTPGYQVRYDREKGEITRDSVNIDEYVAWKNGKYIFRKKRLEDILNTLGRWYDFQVFYQNYECKDILFSGELQRFENFNSILNLLKKSSDADFLVNGNTVQVKTKS